MSERRDSFYHGTIENLQPGSIIKPRDERTSAWATPNLQGAVKHTLDRIDSGLGQSSEGQHPHHGNVYEVEPLENDSTFAQSPNRDFPEAVSSKQGFRVSRQVASVLNPDPAARRHRDPITNKPKDIWSR